MNLNVRSSSSTEHIPLLLRLTVVIVQDEKTTMAKKEEKSDENDDRKMGVNLSLSLFRSCRHISGKVVELFSASRSHPFSFNIPHISMAEENERSSDRTQALKIKLNHPCQTQRSARRVCMNELFNFFLQKWTDFVCRSLSAVHGRADNGAPARQAKDEL